MMKQASVQLDNNRDVISVQDFDVLSGQRGRGFKKHPGNCRYQELIDSNLTRYDEAVLNDQKRLIVYDIIDEITRSGRFLKRTKSSMTWCIQNREDARAKVTKSLQDKNRSIKKQESKESETNMHEGELTPDPVIQLDQFNEIVRPQTMSPVGSRSIYLEGMTSILHSSDDATTELEEQEAKKCAYQSESSAQVLLPYPFIMTFHPHTIGRPFGSSFQASKFHHGDYAIMEPEESDANLRKEKAPQAPVSLLVPNDTIIHPRIMGHFLDDLCNHSIPLNLYRDDVANAEQLPRNCDQSMHLHQVESTEQNAVMSFDMVNRDTPVKSSKSDPCQRFQCMPNKVSVVSQMASQATSLVSGFQYNKRVAQCGLNGQTVALGHQASEAMLGCGNTGDYRYQDHPGDQTFNEDMWN